jgi:hypothetical protein
MPLIAGSFGDHAYGLAPIAITTSPKSGKGSSRCTPSHKQHCEAVLYTNAGRHRVHFTTEWMSAAKDKIWLKTQLF